MLDDHYFGIEDILVLQRILLSENEFSSLKEYKKSLKKTKSLQPKHKNRCQNFGKGFRICRNKAFDLISLATILCLVFVFSDKLAAKEVFVFGTIKNKRK